MLPTRNILMLVLFITVATAFTVAGHRNAPYKAKWLVTKEGAVRVEGSTNVNRFSCSVSGYANADTITCYKKNSTDMAVALEGRLSIPVASFDCLNKMMTKDLRKTLKETDFPMLVIHFISMDKYPELKLGQEQVNGIVDIELAGTKKRIAVNFNISVNNQQVVHLSGTQHIHFSDFNLVPPKKLGGIIKANDKLEVTFNINFKVMADQN